MDNQNFEKMGIDFETTGIKESISQFNSLTKSLARVANQIQKTLGLFKSASSITKKSTSSLKTGKYSKGYLELAKSGMLGQAGAFLLAKPEELQKSILKQQKNLDKAYLPIRPKANKNLYYLSYMEMAKGSQTATKEIKRYNKELEKNSKITENSSNKLWKFAKRLQTLTVLFYSARRLARVISQLVEESGSWVENLNLFAVTFGESNYRETLNWATEYADKLGLANNEIVKMTGYFKQLSTAIGITGEQGTQLSQILTQLTYDFGSFYNVSFDETYQKLQAGIFSGQVRTLRTLGIDISQASIQNLLDTAEGINQLGLSATKLTQTQKVLARTILTMQAGSNAFGDLARSIETLQNRQRIWTASLENLKLALGDFLSGPASDFLAYGIAVVQTITQILRTIVPLKDELEYDIGDNVFTEITEDAEEAEKSMGLLSFDKFQSLSGNGSQQLTATEALNKLLEEQISRYQEISAQFDGVDEKVQRIKDSITKWIFPNSTMEDISKLVESLGEGATLEEKFNAVIGETNITIQSVLVALQKLWKIAQSIWEEVLKPIMKSGITEIIVTLLSSLISVADTLGILKPLLITTFSMNLLKKLGLVTNSVKSLGRAFSFVAGFSIASTILGELSGEGKRIASIIFIIVGAVSALAVAVMAFQGVVSWGTAIPAILTAVGVGTAGILGAISSAKEVSGYATGGIPDKSELFYMNEHGIPEALVNTGGSQTNVINQQQLGSLVQQGFERAIYSTGLIDALQTRITIDSSVNDNAFARAIFPALKTESRRRGGNQL